MNWDEYFLNMAHAVAIKSKDQSTKVGAIVVGPDREIRSTGFNGLPREMNDSNPTYQKRPLKYKLFEHAERNAIFNAARFGASLRGCTIYCYLPPCSDCARAIIQAGIIRSVYEVPIDDCPERWQEDMRIAHKMLLECKVTTCVIRFNPVAYLAPSDQHIKNRVSGSVLWSTPITCDKCTCGQENDSCPGCKGKDKTPDPTQDLSMEQRLAYRLENINFPQFKDENQKEDTGITNQGSKDQTKIAGVDFAPKDHVKENKPRPTLIPFDIYMRYLADMNNIGMSELPFDVFLKYMPTAYEEGIIKYYRESWRNGFPVSVMIDAAIRHITDFFWKRNDYDIKSPTKKHHLSGAIFSLTCILQTLETRPELDDRKDLFK